MHSIMGFDWKKSKAHLLLLSKFIHAQRPDYFVESSDWKNVLGESPEQAIKRFVDEGWLMTLDINELLSNKYKVNELKDMLKQRSLSVSGRKDEMIQRLLQADPNGMRKVVAEVTLLKCTQRGHEIAEQYLTSEKERRAKTEKQVIEYLTNRKFREASLAVAAYEAEQVFMRGMGVIWKHYNPSHNIEILNTIFRSKPRIIAKLEDEKLEALRIGAAMMELWGTNMATQWIPTNFETSLPFDNDTVARMILFYARHQRALDGYRDTGLKYVEVFPAQDSCEACKKLAGKQYRLDEAPELPNPNCTHELGCRCVYLPCVK